MQYGYLRLSERTSKAFMRTSKPPCERKSAIHVVELWTSLGWSAEKFFKDGIRRRFTHNSGSTLLNWPWFESTSAFCWNIWDFRSLVQLWWAIRETQPLTSVLNRSNEDKWNLYTQQEHQHLPASALNWSQCTQWPSRRVLVVSFRSLRWGAGPINTWHNYIRTITCT